MKYTKQLLLIIAVLIVFSISINAQEFGAPFITNYSSKEYNFHNQNFSIVKDKRGVIYFANTGGILEFDGISWRKIIVENNFRVRALAIDNNGTIYVGTSGSFGYLAPDSIGTMQYYSISKKSDSKITKKIPDIWRIRILNNQVYYNAFDALYKYEPYKNTDNINEKITVLYPPKRFFLSYVVNFNFFFIA